MTPKELVASLVKSGLTQSEIAARTGFAQPTISDISLGKIGTVRPSYELVTKLRALCDEIASQKDPQ